MKDGFAPINGLQMYYQIHGSGDPLVLIHGGGSTIESNWTTMIPLLSRSFQVIAIETQSHGRTADIDRDFTFEQDADDVAALLKYFDIDKAHLFGFSNGGQIALQVAIRHPESAMRLVIASAGYKREGFQPWFWPAMQNPSVDHMPPQLKDAFLKVTPDNDRFLKMFWRDANRMKGFQSWKDEDIDKIKSPALVCGGDNDVVTVEHMTEIYRRISGSKLAIFPGGHGDYLVEIPNGYIDPELYKAFANLVIAFLNEK